MKNQLKRQDIFRCNHEAHDSFGSVVSVYHVMFEKRCFPQGCITFEYGCRLSKGSRKCPRRFKFVGRMCHDCRDHYEHKIQNTPRIVCTDSEYRLFELDLERFEMWVDSIANRKVEIFGDVTGVKPRFVKKIMGRKEYLEIKGFLVFMEKARIHNVTFEDTLYLSVSRGQQESFRFNRGDMVELTGVPSLDRGRLVVDSVRVKGFDRRGDGKIWTPGEALVARATAQPFTHQTERCLSCPEGTLVDVVTMEYDGEKTSREIYCLKGFAHPSMCYETVMTCPERARKVMKG